MVVVASFGEKVCQHEYSVFLTSTYDSMVSLDEISWTRCVSVKIRSCDEFLI